MTETTGPLQQAAQVAFYCTAAVTLFGAIACVCARNLFRAALGLALSLFGVAVLYLFLQAEFLAVTQLLIYVGGILTLIIFAVMLTAQIADPGSRRWNRQAFWAFLLMTTLGTGLVCALLKVSWKAVSAEPVSVARIGQALISSYLLPFELLSVLLLGALVGALVIARKESA